MPLAFLDTENNIVHRCKESLSLQENFDIFACKVAEQGLMEMCLGNVHMIQMQDCNPGKSLVHLNTDLYESGYWTLSLPAVHGLVWTAGIKYTPAKEGNPQRPALPPVKPPEGKMITLREMTIQEARRIVREEDDAGGYGGAPPYGYVQLPGGRVVKEDAHLTPVPPPEAVESREHREGWTACPHCQEDQFELSKHIEDEHTTVEFDREKLFAMGGTPNFNNPAVRRDLLILAGITRTKAEEMLKKELGDVQP